MNDEKLNPPSYTSPAQSQAAYNLNTSGMQHNPAQSYPLPQSYPPQQAYVQQQYPQQQPYSPYTPPQAMPQAYAGPGSGTIPPMSTAQPAYTPNLPMQAPIMMTPTGQQYQQQLFALCAAGNHDVTTKHGIAGIILAVVFFPIGLLCLFADVEKRCARCGTRLS